MAYRHLVETDLPRKKLYDGEDPADAMAAWSKAISDGTAEYVMLESLQVGRSD